MNIFILDEDPVRAAQLQCDKHIVKMPLESAQMLSTVHRMLDGTETRKPSKSGKTMVKYWELDEPRESILYKAVHYTHPCTIWTMESVANYNWHYEHFVALHDEFVYRYGKTHGSFDALGEILKTPPKNIPQGPLTPFKLAMGAAPECINPSDPVGSYRAFYQTKQDRFSMDWKGRSIPEWFNVMKEEVYA
jgi:hypothetical protein